jgi:hypothetical protein
MSAAPVLCSAHLNPPFGAAVCVGARVLSMAGLSAQRDATLTVLNHQHHGELPLSLHWILLLHINNNMRVSLSNWMIKKIIPIVCHCQEGPQVVSTQPRINRL